MTRLLSDLRAGLARRGTAPANAAQRRIVIDADSDLSQHPPCLLRCAGSWNRLVLTWRSQQRIPCGDASRPAATGVLTYKSPA